MFFQNILGSGFTRDAPLTSGWESFRLRLAVIEDDIDTDVGVGVSWQGRIEIVEVGIGVVVE